MDRPDGKDPFDPKTYSFPATTIQTMVELRAMCADFFDREVRVNTNTDQIAMAKFIKLITHTNTFFARARAVIPELQVPQQEVSHSYANIQHVLHATQDHRGPPDKRWDPLTEAPFWSQLTKDGRAAKEKEHKRQASTTTQDRRSPSEKGWDTLTTALEPAKSKRGRTNFPEFVPQSAMGGRQLVWSPDSGTRPRRPEEIYNSPSARPEVPMLFSQEISTSSPSPGTIKSSPRKENRKQAALNLGASPIKHTTSISGSPYFDPVRSLTESVSGVNFQPKAIRLPSESQSTPSPKPERVESLIEETKRVREPERHPYPSMLPDDSESFDANRPQYPSSRARGVEGVEPFSAPPSIPRFSGMHATDQGLYSGSVSPYQPRPNASTFVPMVNSSPFVPSPEIWGIQQPPLAMHVPQSFSGPLGGDSLVVPPPGSMLPLDYWNMLYQRETDILSRLEKANVPVADHHRQYLAAMGDARVQTASTQLPIRRKLGRTKWLRELEKTKDSIWKIQRGQVQFTPVIIARKQDFEKAVDREIEMTMMERKEQGGMLR
ncbi:hypothetical protein MMC28_001243 [Mycoblastus sanguinarius]|nr:hypothetical protein [Mycoblastus sanguinarius]